MDYQRLLKVDLDATRGINGQRYVRPEDISKLTSGEELALVYFERSSRHTVLSDFPVKGDCKWVSPCSIIEGPLSEKPPFEKTTQNNGIMKEIVSRLYPASQISSSFTPVELREYGTIMNGERRRYVNFMYGSEAIEAIRLPLAGLTGLGEDVLKRLQAIALPQVVGELLLVSHTARDSQCVLELTVGMDKRYRHYPTVYLRAFGPANATSHYIKQLGLERLNDIFKTKDAQEVGIENSLRRGLAHNLSFERIDLNKIENQDT